MPAATKGLVEVLLPAVKGLYTELPKTCFGESLKWGVLRIAELSWAGGVGSIFILLISLVTGKGGGVAVSLIALLLAAAQVTFSSLLFLGACKGEPTYMKPWFWFVVVLCVLYMVLAVIGIIAGPFLPGNTGQAFLLYFIVVLFFCAILRYCAQVVYALMQQLQTDSTDRKSIAASSVQDGHSDSGSVQVDEDMFTNQTGVQAYNMHYVEKGNDL